jgi:transposase
LEETRREGKRQAAPFRKAKPKADPKPPGRKAGKHYGQHAHRDPPPPEAIDEHYEATLPERCPHCGEAAITETEVVVQYQTEIPCRPIQREFAIHRGRCRKCGRKRTPR